LAGAIVAFEGESGLVPAFLARPPGEEPRPAVIVIHEIFGLVDHTKDVADRFAREGYVALAPNLFGSPELASVLTPQKVRAAQQFMSKLPRRDPVLAEQELAKLPPEEQAAIAPTVAKLIGGLPRDRLAKDLVGAVAFLSAQPFVAKDRIGSVGFCFGGAMSLRLACEAEIAACVVFYGENPSPIEKVKDIRGAVLGLYGADDARINAGLGDLVKAMAENKKDFEMRIYPGAGHAFFNDTNPTTYRKEAASEAWDRVLQFYARILQASR
jgi:carboxymethylenebutenolidase